MLKVGIGLGALGAMVAGGAAVGVGIGSFGWIIGQLGERIVKGAPERIVARHPFPDAGEITVRAKHLKHLLLIGFDRAG